MITMKMNPLYIDGVYVPMKQDQQDQQKSFKEICLKHILPIVAPLILSVVGVAIINERIVIPMMQENNEKMIVEFKNQVNSTVLEFKEDIRLNLSEFKDDTKLNLSEFKETINDDIKRIDNSVISISERMDWFYQHNAEIINSSFVSFYCDDSFRQALEVSLGKKDGPFESGLVSFSTCTIMEKDNGMQYTGADLDGKAVIVSYREGDKEIFFCGQFDDQGLYDGNCLVNIYENGKLTLITDAVYDSGSMLSYKQAYTFTTTSDGLVWAISRKIEDNKGDVLTYFYQDVEQGFSYDEVKASDVLTIDGFEAYISAAGFLTEGYYFGRTSDGFFNDASGESYMVKYFNEDGNVRTLYVGGFQNGNFYDDSENAWMIGKLESGQETYSYYKGVFDGYTEYDDSKGWKYSLTEDEISDYLEGYTFNCPLTGLTPAGSAGIDGGAI